jgi:two-component system, NtrC family, sensor histidine kinase HydH
MKTLLAPGAGLSGAVRPTTIGVVGPPASVGPPDGETMATNPSLGGRRWARWGLLAATFAMGSALVVTSLLSYRSVVQASAMLSESQGESLLRAVFLLVRPGPDLPDRSALDAFLDEQAPAGLRYVAILDKEGRKIVDAGSPLTRAPLAPPANPGHEPRSFLDLGQRIRLTAGPPPPPPEGTGREGTTDADGHRRRRPGIVIEFEPLAARQLQAKAARAFGAGAAAAVGLMVVALLFSRQLRRREAAERRFEEQRRLAVLGEMSSVIAHELRNPLASLKGHAQLLAEKLPEGSRERTKADRIVLEAERLEALSGDLLDFSRGGPIDRREVDPGAVLRAAAESVDPTRIRFSPDPAPRRSRLDPDRMRQALTNLLLNAIQASPAGAPVETAVTRDEGALVFTVRDHGAGIRPEDRERLFEPFYTTRANGTGLGLAVAQRIAQMHGGVITAANEPGGGAVFRIALPGA